MQTRLFFDDVQVSVLGFGGGALSGSDGGYGFGPISDEEAVNLLSRVVERGVNLLDTAPIYGFGASERRIGLFLAKNPALRKKLVLVSKMGVTWHDNRESYLDNSPATARRMLEQSLRDLQTDFIDLYMIHWPDQKVSVGKTMEALLKAKEEGLIRAIGACNFAPQLLEEARAVGPVDVLQNEFNALNRHNADNLFPSVRAHGLGFMSYGTLAKGILSGKVGADTSFHATDVRSRFGFVKQQAVQLEAEVKEFIEIAASLEVSGAVLAAAWVLSHPEVSTALCGTRSPEQFDDLAKAADLQLSVEVKARIDAMSLRATPVYLSQMSGGS